MVFHSSNQWRTMKISWNSYIDNWPMWNFFYQIIDKDYGLLWNQVQPNFHLSQTQKPYYTSFSGVFLENWWNKCMLDWHSHHSSKTLLLSLEQHQFRNILEVFSSKMMLRESDQSCIEPNHNYQKTKVSIPELTKVQYDFIFIIL